MWSVVVLMKISQISLLLEFDRTYSLRVEICWLAFGVKEITILPRVIDAIQLPLPGIQVRLPQGPCLRHCQFLKMIADLNQVVVCLLESLIDGPFPVAQSVRNKLTMRSHSEAGLTIVLRCRTISNIFLRAASPGLAAPELNHLRPAASHPASLIEFLTVVLEFAGGLFQRTKALIQLLFFQVPILENFLPCFLCSRQQGFSKEKLIFPMLK